MKDKIISITYKSCLVCICVFMPLSAYAEYGNFTYSNSTYENTERYTPPKQSKGESDNYSRIYMGYSSAHLTKKGGSHGVDLHLNGFDLGYVAGINITGHKIPLFVEIGGEFTLYATEGQGSLHHYEKMSSSSDGYHSSWSFSSGTCTPDTKYTYMGLNYITTLTYHFHWRKRQWIAPCIGFSTRYNLLGKEEEEEIYSKFDGASENKFVSTKYESDTYKRLIFYMNYGVYMNFGNFTIGGCLERSLKKLFSGMWEETYRTCQGFDENATPIFKWREDKCPYEVNMNYYSIIMGIHF